MILRLRTGSRPSMHGRARVRRTTGRCWHAPSRRVEVPSAKLVPSANCQAVMVAWCVGANTKAAPRPTAKAQEHARAERVRRFHRIAAHKLYLYTPEQFHSRIRGGDSRTLSLACNVQV